MNVEETNRKKSNQKKMIAGSVLIAAGIVLSFAARMLPGFADWYGTHLYRIWVDTVGRFFGIFPFSVTEMLLYVLIMGILISCIYFVIKVVRRQPVKEKITVWVCGLYLIAAVLFFLYVANCGINYHHESFAETADLEVRAYSAEELREVCEWLTEEVNVSGAAVERTESGVMVLSPNGSQWEAQQHAVEAMQQLGETYPEMAGYYPRPKGLAVSWILSIQNLSGIYTPFTIEANYNRDMVDYNIPFTMCHELSHLRGYMQEEEANFIGFLACRASEEASFRYSGNLLGWIYCMNVLYKADYEAWEEVRSGLSEEAEADLKANREFWAKYDGAVAEVSSRINDTYLKANGQDDGVKSYDRMVDLIVAGYREGIIQK